MSSLRHRFQFSEDWLNTDDLPRFSRVALRFPGHALKDPVDVVRRELQEKSLFGALPPGARIAIAVGSRGIAGIDRVTQCVVEEAKRAGAQPFIVPAMGSHGGATPQGQIEVLASLGVTEERVGAPIVASMETVQLDVMPGGLPVLMDREAVSSDGIVLINRVKPHTDYRGPLESGLMKMLVIGLGKHAGAVAYHAQGFDRFCDLIPEAGQRLLARAPVLGGVALVENADHQTSLVRVLRADEMEAGEEGLLAEAKRLFPKLPFSDFHVLVIDWIGKDISGAGMDPNVTGRFPPSAGMTEAVEPQIDRIALLGLTENSYGNAIGMGLADVVTTRLLDAVNFAATYANVLTNACLESAAIPLVVQNDRAALAAALRGCKRVDPRRAKVVRITSTLSLNTIMVSESLLPETRGCEGAQIVNEPEELAFDSDGNLLPI